MVDDTRVTASVAHAPSTRKSEPPVDLYILKTWLEAKLVRDEKGASMVEYGLLVALIAVVAIVAVRFLGGNVSSKFSQVGSAIG